MASPRVQELVEEVMQHDLAWVVKRGVQWTPPFSDCRSLTKEQHRISDEGLRLATEAQEREVFAAQNRLETYRVTGQILGASALVR